MLSDLYPEAISPSIYYMQAIALLERGLLGQSREVQNKGLMLDTDKQPNS
jgi:hypothetical protein